VISPATATTWLAGYIPDLPTPFDQADRIDLRALARLCERQIAAGVSAMVVCETAGEAPTLSTAERDIIIRAAVEITRGRARIIAGAGSNSTSRAIELTRRAEAAGADAVLSVVPYYNKPMQNGLYAHFQAIADSTELPIILHDIPARTARKLAYDTLIRLAHSKKFIGLRDGTGDVNRPMRLRSMLPQNFRLMSGHDATALAYVAEGGDGCISMMSNVTPDLCRALFFQPDAGAPADRAIPSEATGSARILPFERCPRRRKICVELARLDGFWQRLPIVPLAGPRQSCDRQGHRRDRRRSGRSRRRLIPF
jgi:4-hydroxy-tetrahydrodipicolinate synthase